MVATMKIRVDITFEIDAPDYVAAGKHTKGPPAKHPDADQSHAAHQAMGEFDDGRHMR